MAITYEAFDHAERVVAGVQMVAHALAEAIVQEMELADQRPLIKDAAIIRIVESGQERSATAAEKVVERDPEYAEHRRRQYDAVRTRIAAEAAYEVAKLNARLAVAMAGKYDA